MDVITLNDLQNRAESAASKAQQWHFHLLTPTCKLNKSSDFALLLEVDGATSVHYSNEAPKQASKELAKLLHGPKTFEETLAVTKESPKDFIILLKQAEKLSLAGTAWHHHMLYPGCTFSPDPKSWIIMLEDPNYPEPLVCAYDSDPKEDIKLLEQLFYAQQKLA